MNISLGKFGSILTSRQLGREALAAFRPTLERIPNTETLVIDFDGVTTFSPSWGDEFLGALLDTYQSRLILKHTTNPSVLATLPLLEQVHGAQFRFE